MGQFLAGRGDLGFVVSAHSRGRRAFHARPNRGDPLCDRGCRPLNAVLLARGKRYPRDLGVWIAFAIVGFGNAALPYWLIGLGERTIEERTRQRHSGHRADVLARDRALCAG
ncbi:MAG: hypothetical protein HND48_20845 [Chloroflexi bacterium]|nr:hypothetical protein [Chloroflexota bacterium]